MTLLGLPPGVGPECCSDAQSPLGRAGSEGICSQGGELIELSTWHRAINVLCSEVTSWVSRVGLEVTIHHAQKAQNLAAVSVGVEVALRSTGRSRLLLGTDIQGRAASLSQDVPQGKPHPALGPFSGWLL